MSFQIINNDITKLDTEAIVNAANTELQMGGGVCGAIFKAAGADKLQRACDEIGQCPVGKAVITEGFNLKARYIIHTVGPIWRGGSDSEELKLKSAYKSSLELAKEHGIKSIAFPLISSGIFGYPKENAISVASKAIEEFLEKNDMDIYLVLFGK
ncbi:macro domain-containing protein [Alkalibacter saccharofermentans]|uniref:O-acetyl-ADP-ribose deacetylase (Regulator of RNase III), contains Macro domain n=1 Tax=Alkalibacter saccharofermentans DSM 14828 TaxID=1120975 RepID=A0A1M4U437_9FIRM|nr:macro domain-containing protein [Alkalibacter saccharofermentans]SHE51404.1 O-acetyl-ADP-ribose deacetylase (regulator of RNase III), contains Macro domain [Alkalibacter saccharofermentans DSM 14828]